jgi:hypothetical protein
MIHRQHGLAFFPLALALSACASNSDGSGASALAGAGGASAQNGSGYKLYPGSGTSFAGVPLPAGVGSGTADECSSPPSLASKPDVLGASTTCYYGDSADPSTPAATVEEILEVVNDKTVIHVRVTFDPNFVDNSYGDNAIGWGSTTTTTPAPPAPAAPGTMPAPGKMPAPGSMTTMPGAGGPGAGGPMGGPHGHTFKDLVESDHLELELFDKAGNDDLHIAVDYISVDPSKPCGYGTLGVTGGEGQVFSGSASDVLAVATSLDRDLNGCGYCLTESSPATDSNYTPNPQYPKWDFRVVYELWIDAATFGSSGFQKALVSFVHASPSKIGTPTLDVTPMSCPPGWDQPLCSAELSGEGVSCGTGSGGSGGTSGDAGGICPAGWVPDLESEGRFCVPR